MSVLMRSVSGIRGIVGDSLTPPVILNYLNGFLQVTGASRVVVGRDTRSTGKMIEDLVVQGCMASGVEAVILGVASTPTVEMMVPHLKADAGVIITASHNPIEWNALKFLDREGVFLNETQIKRLFKIVDNQDFKWADYQNLVPPVTAKSGDSLHIDSILKLPYLNLKKIRRKKFKVAFDAVNGAGSSIVPQLLDRLGCRVIAINTDPNGRFPHGPEPVPQNLKRLCQVVKEKGCNVGFATDPDADRCAIISEEGIAIGEEYTLALAVKLILAHKKGPVTINLSTSRMNEDIASLYGVKIKRAKVGEINVATMMKNNKSVIGGEGNGGVILPDLHYGRDGVLAVALVLQLMAQEGKSISELSAEFPKYHIEKQKVEVAGKSMSLIFGRLLAKFINVKRDEIDGMRLVWDNKWVHVRASNTEPIIRIIAEAPTAKEARELCRQIKTEI
jgi:phosphomannomutase